MRKSNTQKLDQVVQEYLKALKIDRKLKEVSLVKKWEEIVGKSVGLATKEIYIKDKKLFVYLKSSVVRNELDLLRDDIVKRLNEAAGEVMIEEIILR